MLVFLEDSSLVPSSHIRELYLLLSSLFLSFSYTHTHTVYIFIYFVYELNICVSHAFLVPTGLKKKILGPLKLELQTL